MAAGHDRDDHLSGTISHHSQLFVCVLVPCVCVAMPCCTEMWLVWTTHWTFSIVSWQTNNPTITLLPREPFPHVVCLTAALHQTPIDKFNICAITLRFNMDIWCQSYFLQNQKEKQNKCCFKRFCAKSFLSNFYDCQWKLYVFFSRNQKRNRMELLMNMINHLLWDYTGPVHFQREMPWIGKDIGKRGKSYCTFEKF